MKKPRDGRAAQPKERGTNWTFLSLTGGLVLLLAIIFFFAGSQNGNQDKLTKSEVVIASTPNGEKLCARNATFDLIKHELFRKAAQLRGSDQGAYEKLEGYAVVRMDNPVEESADSASGTVNCSGSLSLDLPPGVAVAGGRRSLMSDVDYSVAPGTDGSGTLTGLRNAGSIITPLATLIRVRQAETQPPEDAAGNETATEGNLAVAEQAGEALPSTQPGFASPGTHQSVDCTQRRDRSEPSICSDPGLGALDRQMAAQYARAFAQASVEQRTVLRDTAHQFYGYRDRCPDSACVRRVYIGRMHEIRDILEGRWQPPR